MVTLKRGGKKAHHDIEKGEKGGEGARGGRKVGETEGLS